MKDFKESYKDWCNEQGNDRRASVRMRPTSLTDCTKRYVVGVDFYGLDVIEVLQMEVEE